MAFGSNEMTFDTSAIPPNGQLYSATKYIRLFPDDDGRVPNDTEMGRVDEKDLGRMLVTTVPALAPAAVVAPRILT